MVRLHYGAWPLRVSRAGLRANPRVCGPPPVLIPHNTPLPPTAYNNNGMPTTRCGTDQLQGPSPLFTPLARARGALRGCFPEPREGGSPMLPRHNPPPNGLTLPPPPAHPAPRPTSSGRSSPTSTASTPPARTTATVTCSSRAPASVLTVGIRAQDEHGSTPLIPQRQAVALAAPHGAGGAGLH